jgi:hypothetical protein
VTVFPFPWDTTFNSEPADNENINLGAGRIRDTKSAIQVREQVDHSWAGDANDGKHVKSEYIVQATDPVLDVGDGAVYTKTIGGNTELFYEDSTGNIIQLTSAGQSASSFPSGTTMTFLQLSPPPGWIQNMGFNDLLVRTVGASGGGSAGGSWVISGLNGSTDNHTLVVGEIPQHTHNVTLPIGATTQVQFLTATAVPTAGTSSVTTDGGTGGGGGHSHTITGSITGDGSWRPAYINACVGTKS